MTLNAWEVERVSREWPTADAMRRAAAALDALGPNSHGQVLRYVADLCDGLAEPPRHDPSPADAFGTPTMFDLV